MVRLFCTACQQWSFGSNPRCNCGKPDNSHELSSAYVRAYREAIIVKYIPRRNDITDALFAVNTDSGRYLFNVYRP